LSQANWKAISGIKATHIARLEKQPERSTANNHFETAAPIGEGRWMLFPSARIKQTKRRGTGPRPSYARSRLFIDRQAVEAFEALLKFRYR
jgi:hypothetical protein